MNTSLIAVAAIIAMGCIASPVFAAADAEPTDLPESSLAKLAKARAKSSTMGSSQQHSGDGSSVADQNSGISDCGINIGNSINPPRGFAPREIIVVVKGDVVNANNRCR